MSSTSASLQRVLAPAPVYVQRVTQYDDSQLRHNLKLEAAKTQALAEANKELTEEVTDHLQKLSDKYEVLEAAVFGPGGLQEQILLLKKEVERLSRPATGCPLAPAPAVPHSLARLRIIESAEAIARAQKKEDDSDGGLHLFD